MRNVAVAVVDEPLCPPTYGRNITGLAGLCRYEHSTAAYPDTL
jgi:hypothetical protein